MTNSEFALFASRIARRASQWAGESSELADHRERPIRPEDADRFIKGQREILDFMERSVHPELIQEN